MNQLIFYYLRRFRWYIFAFILLFVFLLFLVGRQKHLTPPQRHIILGAWTEGLFDAKTRTLHPEKLSAFETLIHKKISIAHYYIGWEALASPTLINQFTTLHHYGWEPMLNVNPYYFSDCLAVNLPIYKAIEEGKCDAFLHKAGRNLSRIKQPFYLLFAWEMNNKQNEWSIPYSGSTPTDFILAWRHIHAIFMQEKATNVVWVFCPNVPDDPSIPYTALYPGNKYVDWIALDGYNWGTTQSWSQWNTFSGVFGSSYQRLTRLAPHKPLMLAEVNTTDQGGNKGDWYTDMFTRQIPYNFPNIQAVVLFNENRSQQEHVNWIVDATKSSLGAFIAAVHSPFY